MQRSVHFLVESHERPFKAEITNISYSSNNTSNDLVFEYLLKR